MANFNKSHSFIVRAANGKDDFRIQLRASYWNSIKSEKRLREALQKTFATKGTMAQWYLANKKIYDRGDVLQVLRNYGMLEASERLINKV